MKIKGNNRLLLGAIVVGLLAGTTAVFYRYVLGFIEGYRQMLFSWGKTGWMFFFPLLILLGWSTGKLLQWAPLSGGSGIPQVHGEILGLFEMKERRVMVSKLLGGALSALAGLSLGREGPSIQLGSAAGKVLARKLGKSDTEWKYFITAGAAAGLSGAFSAPLSGVIFTLEEIHKSFSKTVVMMTLVAACVADGLATWVFDLKPVFSFSVKVVLPLRYYGHLILLGILLGLVGALFNRGILCGQDFFRKILGKDSPKRVALAFFSAGLLGLFLPSLLGGGHDLIESLEFLPLPIATLMLLMIAKALFTFFSFGSGAQGGIFLPTLVVGGITGLLYFRMGENLALLPASYLPNFIILAQAGMLSSVVRSPILAIVLVTEMNGNLNHLLGLALVSLMAHFVADLLGSEPIYHSLLSRLLEGKEPVPLGETVEFEYIVPLGSALTGKSIRELAIPSHVLIYSLERREGRFVPNGGTRIKLGDVLQVAVAKEYAFEAREFFERVETEGMGHG